MNISDIAITSLETITAFDLNGNYRFTLDELQSSTIQQSEEKTDITGKAGRKLSTLKKNKTVTIEGSNGLVSGGLLETQTGGRFSHSEDAEIMWVDYLTVNGKKAETTYIALGTKTAEIEQIFVKKANGALGSALEQVAGTPSDGQFAYNATSKEITFGDHLADGTEIVDGTEVAVYYKRTVNGDTLVNTTNSFSEKMMLYIDAMAEDKCANVYRVQFYIPKADFSGEFSFEMGDNQTVHSFSAEALAGACGLTNELWTYTIFGVK